MVSFSDKIAFTPEAIAAETHQSIAEAIQHRRGLGMERAVWSVSQIYGIKPRRVIQYLRNQVRRVPADEYLKIREKRRDDLAQWARQYDADAERLRVELMKLGNFIDKNSKDNRSVLPVEKSRLAHAR